MLELATCNALGSGKAIRAGRQGSVDGLHTPLDSLNLAEDLGQLGSQDRVARRELGCDLVALGEYRIVGVAPRGLSLSLRDFLQAGLQAGR